MAQELQNRVAFITGGASGIGHATALALAAEGAAIAVADINGEVAKAVAAEVKALGVNAVAVVVDVTDLAAVEAAFDSVGKALGAVDILVNSAGHNDRGQGRNTIAELDLARWDAIMRLNLYGTLYCCRVAVKSMMARRWGRIVNIGSAAGYRLDAGGGAYAVSKAALPALTKILAKEVAAYGVTVNAVAPFFTDTPMLRKRFATREDMQQAIETGPVTNPMHSVLEARDQADAVLYLCKESGRYVTGQTLHVNGGSYMP
jgi:NAD(P)-dependent dehydrogenase (short-subunit alcohol dehydrogenase family)